MAVSNDGDGLPAEGNALFDAFVSVHGNGEKSENLGLGLFIAKAIAEAHGGTIEALDLDESPGARFEVCLPIEVK